MPLIQDALQRIRDLELELASYQDFIAELQEGLAGRGPKQGDSISTLRSNLAGARRQVDRIEADLAVWRRRATGPVK